MPNYLLDAPPILDLDKDLRFYIDDKPYQGLSGYNRLPLEIGVHKIKIPGYKSIGIHIVAHYPLNIFSEILFYRLSLYISYL